MFSKIATLTACSLLAVTTFGRAAWNTLDGNPTRLVGHRGEKAFMPEHSAGSYYLAALLAADYVEPDIVMSKDGVLMVVHNEWLSDTTNVANLTQFADRKKQYTFTGKYTTINRTDYFVWDFTYAELKTLKQVQVSTYPYRPQYFNNDFSVLSFEEYLDEVEYLSKTLDRQLGIIPELKSPEVFNTLFPSASGRGFEDSLLSILTTRNYTLNQPPPLKPVMQNGDLLDSVLNIKPANYVKPNYKLGAIQSFDPETCQYLATKTKIPIVALDSATPTWYTPKGLDNIATFSKIFSPWKDMFVAGPKAYFDINKVAYNQTEIDNMGGFLEPKDLVKECHKRGIELSPYTFYDSRQGNSLLCSTSNDTRFTWCPGDKKEEFFYFFDLGMDYMFVENVFEAQMLRLACDVGLSNKAH